MSKAKRRRQANRRARFVATGSVCLNCGQQTERSHFVSQVMNDLPYWSCAPVRGGMTDTRLVSARWVDGGIETTMETTDAQLMEQMQWALRPGDISVQFRPVGQREWRDVVGIDSMTFVGHIPDADA